MATVPISQESFASGSGFEFHCIDICERIAAAFLLLLASPLLAALWVVILALSGRPPIIAHRRVGRNGSELWLLKFRTMWAAAPRAIAWPFFVEQIDDEFGPTIKSRSDPRVASTFARFCRKHSLDELPQLIQVVSGEMSLVGPRPVTQAEISHIYRTNAALIVSVKPGLSGVWQTSGRNGLTLDQRRKLDIECVRERTARRYLAILLRTVPEVLFGTHSW